MTCRTSGHAKKLDEARVAEIRARIGTRCATCGRQHRYRDLGEEYGVSIASICNIAIGRTWPGVAAAPPAAAPASTDAAIAEIERTVSQRFPYGGTQLTAAIRLTIALTLAAHDRAELVS